MTEGSSGGPSRDQNPLAGYACVPCSVTHVCSLLSHACVPWSRMCSLVWRLCWKTSTKYNKDRFHGYKPMNDQSSKIKGSSNSLPTKTRPLKGASVQCGTINRASTSCVGHHYSINRISHIVHSMGAPWTGLKKTRSNKLVKRHYK